jgi:hypothetical protein
VDARRLTRRRFPGRRILATALLTTCLAACSAGSPAADPSATPTAPNPSSVEQSLQATSGYGRHAAVRAKADLRLVNRGTSEIRLARLQVRHPLFEQVAPAERRTVLPPDGDVHLVPVPLGQPRCDRDDPTGASLVVGVQMPDGIVDAAVPLVDREPGLVRAHRLACAILAVEGRVTIELRTDGSRIHTPAGQGLVMQLHLQRKDVGAVRVTELLGSILFSVAGTPPVPVVELSPDADSAEAEVVLLASRCDQHALIESKTSFTFPLFAAVDGGEPARLSTTASGAARDALQSLLDDSCGATAAEPSTSP